MSNGATGPVNAPSRRAVRASPEKSAERFSVLQPQEVILGLFGEYVHAQDHVWSGGLVNLLGDLGFSVAAARVAINRVCARGLLASQREGRYIFYVMTPRLAGVLEEGRHQTFSPVAVPAWDGQWTFVLYSEPESKRSDTDRSDRARLGRWLNLRDFGMLQEGTWIAPGAIKEDLERLTRKLELEDAVFIFSAALTDAEQIRSIVNRAWDLTLLSRLYDSFLAKFTALRKSAQGDKLSPKQAFIGRTRLIEMFRKMTTLDPNLPDDVLGVNWRRSDAVLLFQELHPLLQASAAHYFHESAIKPG
ncbi:PaaX family transcriptional regulator C-terminal domain-containing protein [Paraburkholderia fungorum]|uniref:PaaX family transcriptional regulator n=1 Tax=Paraburkholderia fungorum TaxID=134537 RepID=UPI0009DF918D|nr:PaaX family transcriptional regulator C-terminal domain-containing protein [Paraburkholderia fungorum]MBU7436191.1 hypothetical protein [Paraburkholderia fungorum]